MLEVFSGRALLAAAPVRRQRRAGGRVSARRRIRFELNGHPVETDVAAHQSLTEVLRTEAGATDVKYGCGEGVCGTCCVLLDGEPVNSCLVFAVQVDGASITTPTGLVDDDGRLHPLQEAFLAHGAAQCGFCTRDGADRLRLVSRDGSPDREQLRARTGGEPLPLHRLHEDPRRRRGLRPGLGAAWRLTPAPRSSSRCPRPPPAIAATATSRRRFAGTLKYADDWALPGCCTASSSAQASRAACFAASTSARPGRWTGSGPCMTAADVPTTSSARTRAASGSSRSSSAGAGRRSRPLQRRAGGADRGRDRLGGRAGGGARQLDIEERPGVFTVEERSGRGPARAHRRQSVRRVALLQRRPGRRHAARRRRRGGRPTARSTSTMPTSSRRRASAGSMATAC